MKMNRWGRVVNLNDAIKTETRGFLGISLEETWFTDQAVAGIEAAWTRHRLWFGTWEHGNLRSDDKGKLTSGEDPLGGKYRCGDRGGATRSSDEVSVMEMEQRGGSNLVWAGQPYGMSQLSGWVKRAVWVERLMYVSTRALGWNSPGLLYPKRFAVADAFDDYARNDYIDCDYVDF